MEERIWHRACVAGVSPTLAIERITRYAILAREDDWLDPDGSLRDPQRDGGVSA